MSAYVFATSEWPDEWFRTFVPRSSPSTGIAAPAFATALTSYPRSLPISPRTAVCFSGTTWYRDLGPLSTASLCALPAFFRSSRKSGVSRPPATVETTLAMPEGVSMPEGVCIPSIGVDSAASSSSSSSSESSSSDSSSAKQDTSVSELLPYALVLHVKLTFLGLQLAPWRSVNGLTILPTVSECSL